VSADRAELNPRILGANQDEKPTPKQKIIPTPPTQYVKHLPGELREPGGHRVEPMQHNRESTVCRDVEVPALVVEAVQVRIRIAILSQRLPDGPEHLFLGPAVFAIGLSNGVTVLLQPRNRFGHNRGPAK
jgi:hypothetical protein